MKKILIASTALISAGLLTAGSASAAEKIKLELGGYAKWMVVGAWQDDAVGDVNTVDVKGDVEVHFAGETTLDNGLTIGVNIELEAGGSQDNNSDTIDESYITIGGNFGQFIIGSTGNGAVLMHIQAPDAAGNIGYEGLLTDGGGLVIPANLNYNYATYADADAEAEKITYVTPSFGGLTLGATYVPNGAEDVRGPVNLSTNLGEAYGAAALYEREFGNVGVALSLGWVTYDLDFTTSAKDSRVNDYTIGTNVTFGGFTVGGSYRNQDAEEGARFSGFDGSAWDLGVQYASGPYAVSAYYFNSRQDTAAGTDKVDVYQVSGTYNLGPGVDAITSAGYAKYSDADDIDNKGFVLMTGIGLTF